MPEMSGAVSPAIVCLSVGKRKEKKNQVNFILRDFYKKRSVRAEKYKNPTDLCIEKRASALYNIECPYGGETGAPGGKMPQGRPEKFCRERNYTMETKHYDIIVAGGGFAGSAAAIAAARKGKKVPFERKGDAFCFRMPAGAHFYNVGREPDMAAVDVDRAVSASDGFTVKWQATAGAEGYEICVRPDGEERSVYKAVGRIPAAEGENAFFVGGLKKGKYFVRVRGTCGEKRGAYGAEYPVFVTSELPAPPAGLRVTAEGNGFRAAWGEVLGCDFYRLYRVSETGNVLVYEGRRREARTGEGEFFVAGVNGNGEGKPSLRRSTEDVRAHWDNHPEKGFVRDTRSHEHGYPGFDYVHNREKPILEYPEGAKGEDDVS